MDPEDAAMSRGGERRTDGEGTANGSLGRGARVSLMDLNSLYDGSLPKGIVPLPGCVVAQYRTVRGKTYGPYYFRAWRDERGRQRKAYVPRDRVEEVRTACRVHLVMKRGRSRWYLARLLSRPRRRAWSQGEVAAWLCSLSD